MVKKLIQHGNSVALIIDKPIMEMLNITHETTFEKSCWCPKGTFLG